MPPKPTKTTQKQVKLTMSGEAEADAKSTEANSEEGALSANQESFSAVLEAIHSLKSEFTVRFDGLLQAINGVQCDLKALTTWVTEAEDRISTQEDSVSELQTQNAKLKAAVESLSVKVDDLENRSRRSNLRLVGLPEKMEGRDMCAFLEKLLPEILGPENFPGPLVIERAHRIGRLREDRSDFPPRAVIMKFLNYADKVRTLKAARAKGTVMLDKSKLMFFSDVSAELHKKRKRFDTVKKDLRDLNIPELRYGILHPATLCVTYKGKRHLFNSPPDAQRFLQDLKDTVQQDV